MGSEILSTEARAPLSLESELRILNLSLPTDYTGLMCCNLGKIDEGIIAF